MKKVAADDKAPTLNTHGHGIYQCYCKKYGKKVQSIGDSTSFCHDYFYDTTIGNYISTSVSVTISGLNFAMAMVNMFLIKKIGYNFNSELINKVMQFVFIAQFINTGILLLLTNANFENSPLSFIPIRNKFSDFSNVWYLTIGKSIV